MSKIYDLSQLEELAGGSEEFVMMMVDTFLEHTPGQVAEIKESFEVGNLTQVGGLAHKIKPNIDLFGISELADVIRKIEAKGKAQTDDGALKGEIDYLSETMDIAFRQLRELRA